jgi:predicted transcriptional regulator
MQKPLDNQAAGKAPIVATRVPGALKTRLAAIAAHRTKVEGRVVTPSMVAREALADFLERAIAEELDADLAAEFGEDP